MQNDVSLRLAKRIWEVVEKEFESGELFEKVSPITKELLRFWFCEPFVSQRQFNFHKGQKQSILNIIYLHEVLKINNVLEIYEQVAPDLLLESDLFGAKETRNSLKESRYDLPKYLVKMATGTGKTWVMHALLIWQILNAKNEEEKSGRFTKNFLIVAPGLIVYDRLLDAYKGRLSENGNGREFSTNDFVRNKDLFVPENYREEVFSFIQNNTVSKEEGIGSKITGNGLIAITNWHLFEDKTEKNYKDEFAKMAYELNPLTPGVSNGNSLDTLDAQYSRGKEMQFLQSLKDIMIINDEAHHIHNNDLVWQEGLNKIMEGDDKTCFQIDFTATPYLQKGSGRNERKIFFPHIVSDFELKTAINEGLVKTISLDRRKELTDLEGLDYYAERDERGRVIGLSDGQKIMLKAGLSRLEQLEKGFEPPHHPKMLVLCEDTSVSKEVESFLTGAEYGLAKEAVLRIDSDSKGEVKETEWKEIKEKLFNIDKHALPKVIVSVLMLREGFDVNNVCVIVPLRAAESSILLEQIVGRGLRLMFREPEYAETKKEIRDALLVKKTEPKALLDLLFIIEHPRFIDFWNNLSEEGFEIGEIESEIEETERVTGDLITVGLKEDFSQWDMYIPKIIKDSEEEIDFSQIDVNQLKPYTDHSLETLRSVLVSKNEVFVATELTVKTVFGELEITANLFNSKSYNIYLQKLVNSIGRTDVNKRRRNKGNNVNLQVFSADIIRIADEYIRTRLFDCDFDPFENNDWKILLSNQGSVTQHIVRQLNSLIFNLTENPIFTDAEVEKVCFSSVKTLKMRENYSNPSCKTIYERYAWPSNKGGFEKAFSEFLEKDGKVESWLKIDEFKHSFSKVSYLRDDGIIAWYSPDFIVKTKEKIYIIETKATNNISQPNVRAKKTAAVSWCKSINALSQDKRMDREWEYVLLSENVFYSYKGTGADIEDICKRSVLSGDYSSGRLNFG
ncbi:MAG: DEAD/DEAH box helicase family protein [Bacteroidales bacterium]|nr:DEAD/DEAH box helicase family protein [Bacteroidales bacterium]